ncbi:hypothetical protein DPEC_G00005860 [Dallia pectoralis]|uniref:Uncharacterized protein n=1 Tax=Dallia pectoralis TaxID=75939 RepID=A0ACC2HK05_DALPE|nr:hypothetical protein DPEC_G00005860 [Dallia pectoralis]
MFQALSSLFFGEVEEVSAEINGPKPCLTEADEEGWMLVNLPGGVEARSIAELIPQDSQSTPTHKPSKTEHPTLTPAPPQSRRRTPKARSRAVTALVPSGPFSGPRGARSLAVGVPTPMSFKRRARLSTPSTSSVSPGSSGSERGCMDESWFVTPPPCFNAEGAAAETSPMEDLLIEHPSMSVYVSPSNLSMISNGNLSVVGEESIASLMGSVSRVAEPTVAPATRNTIPTRVIRGAAAQAGALAKVTQVARVQRGKARTERRHMGCNRIQRQNRIREQGTRHGARTRNTYLQQPCQRSVCH